MYKGVQENFLKSNEEKFDFLESKRYYTEIKIKILGYFRTVKFIDTASRMVVARGWGSREWKVIV